MIKLDSEFLNFILQKRYQVGDRLPPITELANDEHLGVSPSKVREQLEVARTLGMVDVRSKTGTKVKPFSFTPAVRLSAIYGIASNQVNLEHFSELRTHVEIAFWHEACATLTTHELDKMQSCIEIARSQLADDAIFIPNAEHREFHLTVFQKLDNPLVLGILEAYWDAYEQFAINRYMDYEYLQSVWDYHEKILTHIRAGDFDEAQQAFIDHTKLLRFPQAQNGGNNGSSTK